VKPQFEVGREQVGKGGVVRDDALRTGAADKVAGAARALGRVEWGRADSRVPGPKGNREIFLWLSARRSDEVRVGGGPSCYGSDSGRPGSEDES
jgi:23S rRNA (cytidine1920-2'-O)/16S rRNA (cytidine1409-2'-O)-methyltransferase